jgi:Domain of unknown function (DUF4352)
MIPALAVTTLVTGCLSSGHGSSSTAALNDEVHDGTFAFTVTRVDIGTPKIGRATAQGVFVIVDLKVKNLGDGPRTVYCQNQILKDLAGKGYDDAMTIGDRENLINIAPGRQVHVTCAFDVPKGTLPGTLVVHASQFSRGVSVKLLQTG